MQQSANILTYVKRKIEIISVSEKIFHSQYCVNKHLSSIIQRDSTSL